MLRHTGPQRNYKHNLRLAILLGLNAGFINGSGLMAFSILTTNVTGHAAQLAVDVATGQMAKARMVIFWLLSFLAGAFFCGVISRVGRGKPFAYTAPILLMMAIIFLLAISPSHNAISQKQYWAASLLFAMGMQNALVTIISGAVVRTTHLTGMFTDLGTDLSNIIFQGGKKNDTLRRRIILRLNIIVFFIVGGIVGSVLFLEYGFSAFYVSIGLLLIALFYDYFRMKVLISMRRKASRN